MASSRDNLQTIPGVGPSISQDLRELGYGSVAELRGQNPHEMYERLCLRRGHDIDRCVLYVFRCAVYFSETEKPEPNLLKWWSWKE